MTPSDLENLLASFPRVRVTHRPTAIEKLENLGANYGLDLSVKRDDCTGFGFGGNKVRQLEYYVGAAQEKGATDLLITGAVQSNFVRTAAAFAARFGMTCHIQLEERVDKPDPLYRENGNVFLNRLLGAEVFSLPFGEDETAADQALRDRADKLKAEGRVPYVVPLGAESKPTGALGYVEAALEAFNQTEGLESFDEIVLSSGSALTHVGVLTGLRLLGVKMPVRGICVRRAADLQYARVWKRCQEFQTMIGAPDTVYEADVHVYDKALAPGYGQVGDHTRKAVQQAAQLEGLFLDPVYTGKCLAGLKILAEQKILSGKRILYWHTGGLPALFAYANHI